MDRPSPPVQWPSAGRRFLVLAGLTGFAISQPLLSVFGDDPTTLAFHGVEGSSLVLFALIVAVVPPLCLWELVTRVGWVDRQAGRVLHLLAVAGRAACFVVQVLKSTGVVVGGSKLSTDSDGRGGHIAVLLPQGVLRREDDGRAALVVGGEVRELEVVDL